MSIEVQGSQHAVLITRYSGGVCGRMARADGVKGAGDER
jgi:hypothetical protein